MNYVLKEKSQLMFAEGLERVSEEYKQKFGLSQTKLCNIVELNESTFRSYIKSRGKGSITEANLIKCYEIYMMLDEHKMEEYCDFFEEGDKVWEVVQNHNLDGVKENLNKELDAFCEEKKSTNTNKDLEPNELDKWTVNGFGTLDSEEIGEQDIMVNDETQGEESSKFEEILKGLQEIIKKRIIIEVIGKGENFVQFECHDEDYLKEHWITAPVPAETVMMIFDCDREKEVDLLSQNADIELFILVHEQEQKISEEDFWNMVEACGEIENKNIIECNRAKLHKIRVIHNPGEIELGLFFEKTVKINDMGYSTSMGKDASEINNFLDNYSII